MTISNPQAREFTVDIQRRDFSGPADPDLPLQPLHLSWTAFGGPQTADLGVRGGSDRWVDLIGLLRCGVTVRDALGAPVWWGYVDEVRVLLEAVEVRVALEDLANRVSVQYDFISPDNRPGERLGTTTASEIQSEREYGVKERVILRKNIDETYAEHLRDTSLAQHAWPVSILGQRSQPGDPEVRLRCSGWFQTLAWRFYENGEGFYANTGPGPGSFAFGNSNTSQYAGQSFTPGADCALKYGYFLLRNVGGATRSITARLHPNDPWYPGAVLAASEPFDPSGLPSTSYAWARFTFTDPYPLSGGARYWITLNPNGVDASRYFMLRLDQNMTYARGDGRYYDQSADLWYLYPPADRPDAMFRFVCVSDTGEQLAAVAAAGGQFFPRITAEPTGISTSPYRANGLDCLAEIEKLMQLGTADQRLVLAQVSPERHLRFYAQPDPDQADVYLDQHSRFFTQEGVPLKPWFPPVGRFARLSGSNRINLPWDRHRLPACFIRRADYWPESGIVRIGGGD